MNHRTPEVGRIGNMLNIKRIVAPDKGESTQQGRGNVVGMDGAACNLFTLHGIGDKGGSVEGTTQEMVHSNYRSDAGGSTGTHSAARINFLFKYKIKSLPAI